MEGKQLRAVLVAPALIIDGLCRIRGGSEVWLPTCVGIWLGGWMLLREAGYLVHVSNPWG